MVEKKAATVAMYKEAKTPFEVGQTRTMKWKSLVPVEPNDPLWIKRSSEYWVRQMKTYGVKLDDIHFWYNPEDETVTTMAVVTEVLAGQRVGIQ